jgi:S1-C subfamily serine protease
VLGCLPGTPAALAGVRYGDIVLWVNGQRTRSLGDYVEAKALRTDGMNVVVFRSGEEHPVAFDYDPDRPPLDLAEILTELAGMRSLSTDVEDEATPS